MDLFAIILRAIHIGAGVFWVGAGMYMTRFVQPATRRAGPAGASFLVRLGQSGIGTAFAASATLTVLAGLVLYWRDSAGFQLGWISTGPGIGYTLGGLAGIASLIIGATQAGPITTRLTALGQSVPEGQVPPGETAAEIDRLLDRATQIGRIDILLLGFAVLMMAIARYL